MWDEVTILVPSPPSRIAPSGTATWTVAMQAVIPPGAPPVHIVPSGTVFPEVYSSSNERIRQSLVKAGLSLPTQNVQVAGKLTPEQRQELARRMSAGQPLSEIVIEERKGR